MVGVWIEPVTAQVMMTLSDFAAMFLSRWTGGSIALKDHVVRASGAKRKRRSSGKSCQPKRSARKPQMPLGANSITDGDGAQHEQIKAAKVGQRLPQDEKYDRADDRPLHPADAADHRDEDDECGPVVDAERGVGRN